MKTLREQRRRLFFENLEHRKVLAGSVTASVADGVLTISGDDLANSLVISGGDDPGEVVVSGATEDGSDVNRTSVNNDFGPVTFQNVRDIVLELGAGVDEVVVTDLDLAGYVRGSLGTGNDIVSIRSVAPSSPEIDLNGDAEVQYDDVHIGEFVSISGGIGDDLLRLANAKIHGSLVFSGGTGDDLVIANGNLSDNQVGGDVRLTLGAGADVVSLTRLDVGGAIIVNDHDTLTRSNVTLEDVRVVGNVFLDLSELNDFAAISGDVGGDVEIRSYAGDDGIRLSRLDAANVLVQSGLDDDRIVVNDVDVVGTLRVETGEGDDEVIVRNT